MRLAMLVLALACGVQSSQKTYTDEKHGFSIPVPKGWTVTAPSETDPRLIMRAPARDRSGGTLIVEVLDPQSAVNDGSVTLDRFLEEVKKQYPTRFQEFEWIGSEKGKKGKNPTLALYYRYGSSGQTVGQLQYLVWTKRHHYSLTWGCLASKFKQSRKLFEKSCEGFTPDAKR